LEVRGEIELVVGSIVIASMHESEHSCLDESKHGRHLEALLKAAELGTALACTSYT
jgi:hypothetical protein